MATPRAVAQLMDDLELTCSLAVAFFSFYLHVWAGDVPDNEAIYDSLQASRPDLSCSLRRHR
jgi:hypothetical protein